MLMLFLLVIYMHIIKRLKGQEAVDKFAGQKYIDWAKTSLKVPGHEVIVYGKENIPSEACVFIANHQSIFDIPLLVATSERNIGFIAKKELLKVPVIGQWLKAIHSVPIDRDNIREAIKVINQGVENINNGYSMAIFPEGTRAKNGVLKEFKKGSLKLATKANAPIIPVTIDGTYKGYEEGKKIRSAKMTIVFGEPIYIEKLTAEEKRDISAYVKNIIEENLKKIRTDKL